ncbi:cyclic GMP-AMP synthase-like receptor 2 isoform X2 [Ptychodera flava]
MLATRFPLYDVRNIKIEAVGSSFEGLSFPELQSLSTGEKKLFDEVDINVCLGSITAIETSPDVEHGKTHHKKKKGSRTFPEGPIRVEIIQSDQPGYVYVKVPTVNPPMSYHMMSIGEKEAQTYLSPIDILKEFKLFCEYSAHVHSRIAQRENFLQLVQLHVRANFPAICLVAKIHEFIMQFDLAVAIPCRQWPSVCRDWITRKRPSGWPPRHLIDDIVGIGCRLLPRSPKGSVTSLEWRISFGEAERVLADDLTREQKLCYILFKQVSKQFLTQPLLTGLKSYHLKNIFFWALEEVPRGEWSEDKICERVIDLLHRLNWCLLRHKCPGYFIPQRNLFAEISGDLLFAVHQRLQAAILHIPSILNRDISIAFLPQRKSRRTPNSEMMKSVFELKRRLQDSIHWERLVPEKQMQMAIGLLRDNMEAMIAKWHQVDDHLESEYFNHNLRLAIDTILCGDFVTSMRDYRWDLVGITPLTKGDYFNQSSIDLAAIDSLETFHKILVESSRTEFNEMGTSSLASANLSQFLTVGDDPMHSIAVREVEKLLDEHLLALAFVSAVIKQL